MQLGLLYNYLSRIYSEFTRPKESANDIAILGNGMYLNKSHDMKQVFFCRPVLTHISPPLKHPPGGRAAALCTCFHSAKNVCGWGITPDSPRVRVLYAVRGSPHVEGRPGHTQVQGKSRVPWQHVTFLVTR